MRAALMGLALLLVPTVALAQVPAGLTYQGRLLNSDGTPVAGTVTMVFALFDTQTSTSALWTEQQSVALVDGFYSLVLGSQTPLSQAQFAGAERWLEISVNGHTLSPRAKVESIPYALMSSQAHDLRGGTVEATSVTVAGQQVIDATGKLTAAAYSLGSGLQLNGGVLSLPGNCGNGQVLQWGGSAWTCASTSGTGTVTNVTGTAPVVVANGASAPVVSLTSSCAASQVLKWNGSAWACADGGTPPGGIIMYSGAWSFDATGLGTGALAGWALCNGSNGTPNLADRFVAGAVVSTDLGTSGGANSYSLTLAQLPAHSHSFTGDPLASHSHLFLGDALAAHSHTFTGIAMNPHHHPVGRGTGTGTWDLALSSVNRTGATDTDAVSAGTPEGTNSSDSAGTPSGTLSSDSAGTPSGTVGTVGTGQAIDNRPAFVKLAYIMKL